MRILLLKSWVGNIGDGFVKKGAYALLRKAFPNAEMVEASAIANCIIAESGIKGLFKIIGQRSEILGPFFLRLGRKWTENDVRLENIVNSGELIDVDLIVLTGCVLNVYMEMYLNTLEKIGKEVPVVFLGVGGHNYQPKTRQYVTNVLKKIPTKILITRDRTAYDFYSKFSNFSYDGIDCAFFVNDYYTPSKSKESFIIIIGDHIEESIVVPNMKIIHPIHSPFTHRFRGFIDGEAFFLRHYILNRKNAYLFKTRNFFISDNIKEYLFLYSNAKELHSDRVHACVAALAYGTPTKFYGNTPRAKLLDRMVGKKIYRRLSTMNVNKATQEKERQVSILREFVSELV